MPADWSRAFAPIEASVTPGIADVDAPTSPVKVEAPTPAFGPPGAASAPIEAPSTPAPIEADGPPGTPTPRPSEGRPPAGIRLDGSAPAGSKLDGSALAGILAGRLAG